MRNETTIRSPFIATAMAVGLFALANAATASTTQTTPAADPPQADASQASGMRAYVDPKTGKLRQATPEERQEEARVSAQAAKDEKPVEMEYKREANGAVRGLDVSGSLMETAVATQNADGTWSVSYVEGTPETVTPAAPATSLEEK